MNESFDKMEKNLRKIKERKPPWRRRDCMLNYTFLCCTTSSRGKGVFLPLSFLRISHK